MKIVVYAGQAPTVSQPPTNDLFILFARQEAAMRQFFIEQTAALLKTLEPVLLIPEGTRVRIEKAPLRSEAKDRDGADTGDLPPA